MVSWAKVSVASETELLGPEWSGLFWESRDGPFQEECGRKGVSLSPLPLPRGPGQTPWCGTKVPYLAASGSTSSISFVL